MAIFAEVTENECIIERHLCVIDASLIYIGAFSMSDGHSTLSVDFIEMGLPALCGFSLSVRLSVTFMIHA